MPGTLLGNTVPAVFAHVRRVGKHVEAILLLVRRALMEPEQHTSNKRQNSNGSVVPHQQRVLRQRDKRLTKRVGERRHEVPVGCNKRSHVLGGLGEGELQTGNRCENLGETDEHVRNGLRPHVDGRESVARVHVLAALAGRIDVVLDDSGADHGEGREQETECDTLDGRELDAGLAKCGVEEVVDNGDEDDERDGVQVGDDVVGDTVTLHGGGLGGQVVVHLVVRKPYIDD